MQERSKETKIGKRVTVNCIKALSPDTLVIGRLNNSIFIGRVRVIKLVRGRKRVRKVKYIETIRRIGFKKTRLNLVTFLKSEGIVYMVDEGDQESLLKAFFRETYD